MLLRFKEFIYIYLINIKGIFVFLKSVNQALQFLLERATILIVSVELFYL